MNKLNENRELTLSCSISGFQKANFSVLRRNSNGDVLLGTSRNLTMRVSVNDTGSYICKAEVKGIVKESKPVRINVYGELIHRFRTNGMGGNQNCKLIYKHINSQNQSLIQELAGCLFVLEVLISVRCACHL